MTCGIPSAWQVARALGRSEVQGLTRFDEFQRSLNIARNTLSDRLGKLVDAGVMVKRFYQDNPPRYEPAVYRDLVLAFYNANYFHRSGYGKAAAP